MSPPDAERLDRWLTIPNVLCVIRLVGAFVLVGLALTGPPSWFVPLLVVLLLTDWIDGKLAILLRQRSTFGARLDSVADVALYAALFFGLVWLRTPLFREEAVWLLLPGVSYAVSAGVGWAKFGRVPSYHTRSAKTSWLLVSIAAVVAFADGPRSVIRFAAAFVVLTNLEGLAITAVLPRWQADVLTIVHALRIRRDAARDKATSERRAD